jgi:hypothetical protein
VSELPQVVRDLINEYQDFQKQLPIRAARPELHDLVRFNGNKRIPVHSWFTYKEGFSASLLPWLCENLPCQLDEIKYLLDPFCGAGTSLLSAQMLYSGHDTLEAFGLEHNPFARFVTRAKLSWAEYCPKRIAELLPKLLTHQGRQQRSEYEVPTLSTIQNPKVFSPLVLQDLLHFRHRILEELEGTPEKDFFLLGWASVIERVSGVRKDGRALRFTEKSNLPTVVEALESQWSCMLNDLYALRQARDSMLNVKWSVLDTDGRTLKHPALQNKKFDLILYSPPYLNNIDYSEVYKLELWLSGHVWDAEQFKALRLGTFRSHPSVKFPDTDSLGALPQSSWPLRLQSALIAALPENADRLWRTRLIKGYMDDMHQALKAQFLVADRNTPVVCVIGNSLHGRKNHPILIATDLLIAALAQTAGFRVEALQVMRQLRRRDHENGYLRETVLMMRRMR